MDAITHTILAIIVIAAAWYGGRWALIREARSAFPEHDQDIKEIRRFMQLITAINHMGINPDQNISMASDEGVSTGDVSMPRQLDLFLAQGSSGGTDCRRHRLRSERASRLCPKESKRVIIDCGSLPHAEMIKRSPLQATHYI